MNNYVDYMRYFNYYELRDYLGQELVELLNEWFPNAETILSKQKLIEMINSIYGTSILKEKKFRKSLLLCVEDPSVILKIRDECLSESEKTITNPYTLIDIIVDKPWNKSALTTQLLNLWGVSDTIFDRTRDESVIKNEITCAEEQFFELLDYQYLIKQRVLNNLNSGYALERMLVHMPTGTGKTKTTMHIIANYINFTLKNKGVVIWIAHTIELLQQAYDTFENVWNHLGNENINVYKLWGNKTIENVNEPINGVIFCGLAKLMSIASSNSVLFERLKKDCRLVIFDEAHKAAAKQTQKVIEELMKMPEGYENRALIGLTATPGRSTEASYDNSLLANMFGNKLINIDAEVLNQINLGKLRALNAIAESNIIKYFQERKILAKMRAKKLSYQKEFTERELSILKGTLQDLGYGDKDYTNAQLKVLATNKARNLAIMKELRKLYLDKTPTIVFACSVDHAKILSAMLTLENIPNSLILGEMDPMDRKKAIDVFKDRNSVVDIIINYEVLTTGFDSKNIKCVFITRPTKSIVLYSQMLGRGLRGPLMGGNEECTLVDIEDNLQAFDNETAFSHFNNYWRV